MMIADPSELNRFGNNPRLALVRLLGSTYLSWYCHVCHALSPSPNRAQQAAFQAKPQVPFVFSRNDKAILAALLNPGVVLGDISEPGNTGYICVRWRCAGSTAFHSPPGHSSNCPFEPIVYGFIFESAFSNSAT